MDTNGEFFDNYLIIPVLGDGNCLFRCISYFLYGNPERHRSVRLQIVEFIVNDWDTYVTFVPSPYNSRNASEYMFYMGKNRIYGGEPELHAASRLYNRRISVFLKSNPGRPIDYGNSDDPMRLLYSGTTDYGHYEVLVPNFEILHQLRSRAENELGGCVDVVNEIVCNNVDEESNCEILIPNSEVVVPDFEILHQLRSRPENELGGSVAVVNKTLCNNVVEESNCEILIPNSEVVVPDFEILHQLRSRPENELGGSVAVENEILCNIDVEECKSKRPILQHGIEESAVEKAGRGRNLLHKRKKNVESEQDRQIRLQIRREYDRRKREMETDEERESRLKKRRERSKETKKQIETEEEKHRRPSSIEKPEEERNKVLNRRKLMYQEKKNIESEQDRQTRLQARREYRRRKIEMETDEERENRLKKRREKSKETRNQKETKEEKQRRLQLQRENEKLMRANEGSEEKNRRLSSRREKNRSNQNKTGPKNKTYRAAYIDISSNLPTPLAFGNFDHECSGCGALFLSCEVNGKKTPYSKCCQAGKVSLENLNPFPNYLEHLFGDDTPFTRKFRDNIRRYNSSFAFASMGASTFPPRRGPYCFKIHGQIYHDTFGIAPPTSGPIKYAQLYVIETRDALEHRRANNDDKLNEKVMQELDTLLREINIYAKSYRMLKEVYEKEKEKAAQDGGEVPEVCMWLARDKLSHSAMYQSATANEVAVVFRTADGEPPFNRDICVHFKDNSSIRISPLSQHVDPMIYPLLFPFGEHGWQMNMPHVIGTHNVTLLQFYAFRIAFRKGFNQVLSGGKLTQQYLVDAYIKVEGNNLFYYQKNQKQLRVELYSGLMDYLHSEAAKKGIPAGRPVILPSTFHGGRRSMTANYQNAMAIVRKFGKPDFFITITMNPKSKEVVDNLRPFEKAHDRPDLMARLFKAKLNIFLRDLLDNQILGVVIAHVYVIEFQKLGLPHAHILLIVRSEDKIRNGDDIDKVVCAELPEDSNSELYAIVSSSLIHGPCGKENPNAPCMVNGKCSKGYPKAFREVTSIGNDGYPGYRRRDNGRQVVIKNKDGTVRYVIDNRWVVPYNPYLLLKYQCHINVEICCTIKSVKYLYMYLYKGHDTATLEVNKRRKASDQQGGEEIFEWDEISCYRETRILSAPEACWRLNQFKMHNQIPAVITLAIHLPNEQPMYYEMGEEEAALVQASCRNTTLTAYLNLNVTNPEANELLYTDVPEHYVFKGGVWKPRKQRGSSVISRMYSVSPMQSELYHLRLLLLHVKGCSSFEDFKVVNGTMYATFKEAARARGLIDDDGEYDRCLSEAVTFKMPKQLRQLFAYILVFENPTDPLTLWAKYRIDLIEDFLRQNMWVTDAENAALFEINEILGNFGKCCSDFNLPMPQPVLPQDSPASVDSFSLSQIDEAMNLISFNAEQKLIFDEICGCLSGGNSNRLYFIDGPGGTGKSFVYAAILTHLKNVGKTAVVVAWTGIAAMLLEGGRTVHSTFKLPVPLLENSCSNLRLHTVEAKRIKDADIIIWDEVTMASRYSFTAIDRFLKELMNSPQPFGGKLIVLGGDFRQCLPIVKHGTKLDVIEECIVNCIYWPLFVTRRLTTNMRVSVGGDFPNWLLSLGNGDLNCEIDDTPDCVVIPNEFIVETNLADAVFGESLLTESAVSGKVILAPTNDEVDRINEEVLSKVSGSFKVYTSVDKVECSDEEEQDTYLTEFVNSQTPSGMPPHLLKLKVGAVVMLLRNLNIKGGLCNGARLIVMALGDNFIQCKLISGHNVGEMVFIPRIVFTSDADLPFKFYRKQYPLKLAYAMTINKAQGQTLDFVGIYLLNPVFSHGQLYVAFSRCRQPENLKVWIRPTRGQGRTESGQWYTKNIVFYDILTNVQR